LADIIPGEKSMAITRDVGDIMPPSLGATLVDYSRGARGRAAWDSGHLE
jgi:hypothetical protein